MTSERLTTARAALDLVLADVKRSGRPVRDHASTLSAIADSAVSGVIDVHYGGHTFPLENEEMGEITATIAHHVQDDVIIDFGSGWPMSADGQRLLLPRVDQNGAAHWVDRDVVVAPIGSLPA